MIFPCNISNIISALEYLFFATAVFLSEIQDQVLLKLLLPEKHGISWASVVMSNNILDVVEPFRSCVQWKTLLLSGTFFNPCAWWIGFEVNAATRVLSKTVRCEQNIQMTALGLFQESFNVDGNSLLTSERQFCSGDKCYLPWLKPWGGALCSQPGFQIDGGAGASLWFLSTCRAQPQLHSRVQCCTIPAVWAGFPLKLGSELCSLEM